MTNLKSVMRDFKGDAEILRPFSAMMQVEEVILTLTIARNGGKQPTPQQMMQMMQNIQNLTQFDPRHNAGGAATSSNAATSSSGAATSNTASQSTEKPKQNQMEK